MKKMQNILVLCLALLLCPTFALAGQAAPTQTPDKIAGEPATAEPAEELTEEEQDAVNAVSMPAPSDWRKTVETAFLAADFVEDNPFETGEIAVDPGAQYRYESKWDEGKIVLWQEVYTADRWAGYGLIFAVPPVKTDTELVEIAAHCREATLLALAATHPKLSADKIATFLNALCPDYMEVAKSPTYIERSAPLGTMVYTVTGGGTWGFPSIQAFDNPNADAYLKELQGTK